MSRVASHNTNLERLIAEMRAAEGAGVFAHSRVDAADLLASGPTPSKLGRFYEWAMVGLPLAACLAIVVGLAALNGGPLQNAVQNAVAPSPVASLSAASERCDLDVIAGCLSGPGAATADECSCADFDEDGDVDMLDMSSYQRMVASAN